MVQIANGRQRQVLERIRRGAAPFALTELAVTTGAGESAAEVEDLQRGERRQATASAMADEAEEKLVKKWLRCSQSGELETMQEVGSA